MKKLLAKRLTIMFARIMQLICFIIIGYEVLWNYNLLTGTFFLAVILVLESVISRVERAKHDY